MRTSTVFLWAAALSFALAVAAFLFATLAPGYGESTRALVLVTGGTLPAAAGIVCLAVGASALVLERPAD